ncbi:MAG TPA: hypothetical protein VFE34_06325 [Dongiaceae bacterium]|nr:hypothetical protein [Dongiaceae bacterium]
MPDNDNQTPPPVLLDEHRGMVSQKETEARRHLSEVEADQAALRLSQAELEKFLFAAPAADWPAAAQKALYLLRLFATTPEARDPRLKQLIEDAMADLDRLSGEVTHSHE